MYDKITDGWVLGTPKDEMKIEIPSSELGRNERYGQEQNRVVRIRGVIVFGAGPYLCATRVWMSEYKVQRCKMIFSKLHTVSFLRLPWPGKKKVGLSRLLDFLIFMATEGRLFPFWSNLIVN
ncbi:hypothetical protein BofuT4_P102520.1 [Botrytis cinerea T4]|uniref:Uncharacterized protein n=1 Tax=Botryotinia fuckeliana (strain T4) TaxID=999810 RepID=G2YBG0_BOTF4|nr:hypothetical protein BofuT4_P102520.1 [Botrytis cinerea T4]